MFLAAGLFPPGAVAASPWHPGVGRTTSDRRADLLAALVAQRRFDEAAAWCEAAGERVAPSSDQAAWWAIQRCRVETARRMDGEDFDDAAVDQAQQEIRQLLQDYEDHSRRLFLLAELRTVEYQAARHDVIVAAITPNGSPKLEGDVTPEADVEPEGDNQFKDAADRAAPRIARLSAEVDRLAATVSETRIELGHRRSDTSETDLAADLLQLEQRLLVRGVEVALLGSELFPAGSDDHVAAASAAEGAAAAAIGRLPPGSTARPDLQRLWALATLRSGDPVQADERLKPLLSEPSRPPAPRVQAVAVLIDLALNRRDDAVNRVREYYGNSPSDAPRSLEMDLAALRLRLASDDESFTSIGGWIDLIEQRHGPYARRRAEAIALAELESDAGQSEADPESPSAAADTSIVAAQGRDWLRRGNPRRGGNLLAAAARREADPDAAIQRASEAAAAFVSAEEFSRAAAVLAETAQQQPEAAEAAAAHLQAAVLSARRQAAERDEIEAQLRTTIDSWPESEAAESARLWLAQLLVGNGQDVAAAEVLTSRPTDQLTGSRWQQAVDQWRAAYRSTAVDAEAAVGERFLQAVGPHLDHEKFGPRWLAAATPLVDRDTLGQLPPLDGDTADDPFIRALDTFRRSGTQATPLQQPPRERASEARWRLMRDARADPSLRTTVAKLLEGWPPTAPSDPTREPAHRETPGNSGGEATAELEAQTDRAERLVWLGRIDDALDAYREAADRSDSPGTVLRDAAEVLAGSGTAETKTAAIVLWEELADGMPKGRERWHEAKLAVCQLLQQSGNGKEASRRAQYVLLTNPPESPAVRQRYEQFTTNDE